VQYIYEKQLEEAEFLVLNKIDIASAELRERLGSTLARRFPRAEIHSVSARTGLGMAAWLDRLLETTPVGERPTMDVDYDLYADGEALLGWVNATARLAGERAVDGNRLLRHLAESVRERLTAAAVEIAHMKVALVAGGGAPDDSADRATIHLVRTDGPVEMPRELSGPIRAGELVVNLRAEDDPARLHALLLEAIAAAGQQFETVITLQDEAHFRPGRPVPTHRVAVT
jgi:hypothetical protein